LIGRALGLLTGLLAAMFLLTVAVANRHCVRLVLDPFSNTPGESCTTASNAIITVDLPFYAYLFAMLISGVILGGMATYMSQMKWRKAARLRTQDSIRWKAEADRLVRERDAAVAAAAPERRAIALANR
jgi:uncharacterized integral membrane protein